VIRRMSMKNSNYTTWYRTRDLPICSTALATRLHFKIQLLLQQCNDVHCNVIKGGGEWHLQLISYAPGVLHSTDDQCQLHMRISHQLCKSYRDRYHSNLRIHHTQVNSQTALLRGTLFCEHSTTSAGSKLYCSCNVTSTTLLCGGKRKVYIFIY